MEQPETTEIYLIHSDHGPLHIGVNGVTALIPLETDFPLDNRLLPALHDTAGISWRVVGEAGGGDDVGGRAVPAANPDEPPFDAEALILANADEVIAALADLTPDQLVSVKDAEADREKARVTVLRAIDEAIAAANHDA